MTIAHALLGAAAGLLAAFPAAAQSGLGSYAGTWIGEDLAVEAGSWPELGEAFIVSIEGSDREFEAGWSGLVPDGDAAVWDALSQDFERAERAGYFEAEDDADIFDGEPQYWAFAGEQGLVLGRLQIDADSGRHVIFVCRLVPTDTGLDAELVLSAADTETARARISLVKQ